MNENGYFFKDYPLLDQLVAGCAAGGTATLLLHPLDLLKTRFQATADNSNRVIFAVPRQLRAIFQMDGFKGLYRGFSANFAGSTTSWGVYFLLYKWIKSKWDPPLTGSSYFFSSASAGMLTVLITNPLWLAKTRLCQPGSGALEYRGLTDCLLKTHRKEGVRGLYRGLIPGLIGTLHGAVQFLVYENLKKISSTANLENKSRSSSVSEYLVMSSTSKVVASVITYPYQVVRCRLQLSGDQFKPSVLGIVLQTWRQEGIIGFYKGIVPNVLRVLPGTCITFLIYEELSSLFSGKGAVV